MINLERVLINPDDQEIIYDDIAYECDETLFDIFIALVSEIEDLHLANTLLEHQTGAPRTLN